MTDFLTIGFTILATCATYITCTTLFRQLEAHYRRQQYRQTLKDTVIISRELRAWLSLYYTPSHNLNIQTAPIHLNTSPVNVDLHTNTSPPIKPTSSNLFSTLSPLLSLAIPYLINSYLTSNSSPTPQSNPLPIGPARQSCSLPTGLTVPTLQSILFPTGPTGPTSPTSPTPQSIPQSNPPSTEALSVATPPSSLDFSEDLPSDPNSLTTQCLPSPVSKAELGSQDIPRVIKARSSRREVQGGVIPAPPPLPSVSPVLKPN